MTEAAPSAAVVGAGPAGLMAAETLANAGVRVTVFDRMPSVGRKFLLAGRGGLNLTHAEPLPRFLDRYGSADPRIRTAVERFPPERLRAWCEALGEPTFVGSSGRVFPRAMKASPLLRAWLRRLGTTGVTFATRHRWAGWAGAALRFETPDGSVVRSFPVTVLALGGASWPQLGSDGSWIGTLAPVAAIAPLRPANCGFLADWTPLFRDRFEGVPLKNVSLAYAGTTARGDLTVTRTGLEGGPVYGLGPAVREAILGQGSAAVTVDLRPDLPAGEVGRRLGSRDRRDSIATALRKALRLPPVAIGLLQEAAIRSGEPLAALDRAALAARIKDVPITLSGVAPIARAISTAGGVAAGALDDAFMLAHRPGVFVAGEMLDWEAPTGGYLLQACFATGVAAGQGALGWLGRRDPGDPVSA